MPERFPLSALIGPPMAGLLHDTQQPGVPFQRQNALHSLPPQNRRVPTARFDTYVNMPYAPAASSSATEPYAAYIFVQRYLPHRETDMLASYPLSLHPRATIETYRSREPQPLTAPCRQCAKPTPISPTQQKLFQTIERLLQKPMTANVSDKRRNDWAVDYGARVSAPSVAPGIGIEGKGQAWPFVDEFELDVVMKLLRKVGEGLNERCLDMYLLILKSMDGSFVEVNPGVQPPVFGTPRKPKSYRSGRYVPSTPPEPTPLRSSVSSILVNNPPLHSFRTLKDLFEIFDRIEQGSYAAARLIEAYADVVVNEACIDCWAKHNIIHMGEEEEGDIDFVGLFQSLDEKGSSAGLVDNQGFGAPVETLGGDMHPSQTLHTLPKPQNSQTPHTLMRPRAPFSEVGTNSRDGELGKRTRDQDKEEEDELERRWRERAKKREAAWRGSGGAGVNQTLGPNSRGEPVGSETQARSREGIHARICQGGEVARLDGFRNEAMLRERGEAEVSDRRGIKETKAMLGQVNAFTKKNIGSGTNVTPKKWNWQETSFKVSQPVRGGTKILGPGNLNKWVKQENRTAKGKAKVGGSSKPKQWSVEEINGKEFIVID